MHHLSSPSYLHSPADILYESGYLLVIHTHTSTCTPQSDSNLVVPSYSDMSTDPWREIEEVCPYSDDPCVPLAVVRSDLSVVALDADLLRPTQSLNSGKECPASVSISACTLPSLLPS